MRLFALVFGAALLAGSSSMSAADQQPVPSIPKGSDKAVEKAILWVQKQQQPRTGFEKAINKAIPSTTPAEKKDDIYDADQISAPVAYRDLMLVVVSAKGASAVTFKDEDDDESVSYQFRYESRDRKEKYEGRGKVAGGGIETIKAGGVTLLWSRARRGHGWIYYNPDKTAVHLAHEQDYADRVAGLFGERTALPKLDLRRFMK